MKTLDFETADGRAIVYVGDASEFAENDDVPAAVLGPLKGAVAWIEWIEAARPRSGNSLLEAILVELHAQAVDSVGAHVVPVGVAPDAPAVRRLAAFYSRHGFTDVSELVPWSEWPAMVAVVRPKPLSKKSAGARLDREIAEALSRRSFGKRR